MTHWRSLSELRPGAVFETREDGYLGVRGPMAPGSTVAVEVTWLDDGERGYTHVTTEVRELRVVPWEEESDGKTETKCEMCGGCGQVEEFRMEGIALDCPNCHGTGTRRAGGDTGGGEVDVRSREHGTDSAGMRTAPQAPSQEGGAVRLEELLAWAKANPMTAEQRLAQRIDWAAGQVAMSCPGMTIERARELTTAACAAIDSAPLQNSAPPSPQAPSEGEAVRTWNDPPGRCWRCGREELLETICGRKPRRPVCPMCLLELIKLAEVR